MILHQNKNSEYPMGVPNFCFNFTTPLINNPHAHEKNYFTI